MCITGCCRLPLLNPNLSKANLVLRGGGDRGSDNVLLFPIEVVANPGEPTGELSVSPSSTSVPSLACTAYFRGQEVGLHRLVRALGKPARNAVS